VENPSAKVGFFKANTVEHSGGVGEKRNILHEWDNTGLGSQQCLFIQRKGLGGGGAGAWTVCRILGEI